MPELAGYQNEVFVLAGTVPMSASTGAKIEGVDNSTFGKLAEMLDITAFGDTYRRRMAGLKDTTMSISGNVYTGDATGQNLLEPGDSIYIGIYPSGSKEVGSQIPAIVESFEVTSDVAGKQTFSCAIAANGAPVTLPARSTVPPYRNRGSNVTSFEGDSSTTTEDLI